MHLNKILEQIKRHQSPTEAIDKLATALEKHEGSLLEKGFTILKSELAANMYEAINGPHFDEEHAHYAVEGMENNERIIVQDRGGIDAGIAALMQNANKGFDPAALMAMMNNGNGMFGGNGGWWWIFIIVLFWMWGGWGGNGFGRGNQAETNSDFARLAAMGNQNNNNDDRFIHRSYYSHRKITNC